MIAEDRIDESSNAGDCRESMCDKAEEGKKVPGPFPCLSEAEARAVLQALMSPHIQVEVAGGILRHHIR